MTKTKPSVPTPLRVLVVENDAQWRKDHVENLRLWGYKAYFAEPDEKAADKFQALRDDAIDKARRFRCHVALVDMRLKSDSNSKDTSGLDLVPELAPTVSIIVSGYGDRKTVRDALKSPPDVPQRANDFVGKEDGPDLLRQAIEEVEKAIWCRREVNFARSDELDSPALITRFFPQDGTVPPDEVDDVLRRLFPQAHRLKIELAGGTERTSGLLLRRRSVVLRVHEDDHTQPVIVKLARSGRIGAEISRFKAVYRHFSTGRYADPLGNPVELWDLGGMVYRLVDSDQEHEVMTFSRLYTAKQNYRDIVPALVSFEKLWHIAYTIRPTAPRATKETIFKAYSDDTVWGSEWHQRLLKHSEDVAGKYPDCFAHLSLPNPISWLIKKVKLTEEGDYDDGGVPDTVIAITHGDLHGDNFFVDTRHDVWVIDYERTGFGPILQDWTELENDILTYLAKVEASDWPHYYQLLLALLAEKKIELPSRATDAFAGFAKEWEMITELRRQAVTSSGIRDSQQYQWGILLNSLFRLTFLLKERAESRKLQLQQDHIIQRCLILAGMICHRLDNWNRVWPPASWSRIMSECELGVSTHKEQVTPGAQASHHEPGIMPNQRPDFVLVTALQEERDAVLSKLPGYRKLPPSDLDVTTCYQVELPVAYSDDSTGAYLAVVMPLLGMGRVKAATATANAISRWHPRYVLLVGIAGGIAERGVKIGDILVSDQIVDYEIQKHTPDGVETRYEVHAADPRLLSASQNFGVDNWLHLVQVKRPVRGKAKCHIGPIASGDKVVAFADVLRPYRESWPRLIGVEMEAAGVATAAFQADPSPGFLMIRCVSDLADKNKNSVSVNRWRSHACDAAASFAVALLKSGPVPPQSR